MAATGAKLLRLLTAAVEGRVRPVGEFVAVNAILPSFNMRTTDGPMAEVEELARQWMGREGILDVSVFGGFAYGDSPYAGASVTAFADGDIKLARDAAAYLVQDRLGFGRLGGQWWRQVCGACSHARRCLDEGTALVGVQPRWL